MRSGNRACWTGCDATVACSAAIRDRLIRRQFKRGQNFREKKPGPEPLIDKHGAFAVPANASLRGMIPFQHRPGVDITFLLSAKAAKKLVDPVQLCLDYIVIVVAPRVSRDPSCSSCSRGPVGPRLPENNLTPRQRSIARRAEPSPDRNVFPRRVACNSFRRARRRAAIHESHLRAPARCRRLRDTNQTRSLSQKRQAAPSVLLPKSAS